MKKCAHSSHALDEIPIPESEQCPVSRVINLRQMPIKCTRTHRIDSYSNAFVRINSSAFASIPPMRFNVRLLRNQFTCWHSQFFHGMWSTSAMAVNSFCDDRHSRCIDGPTNWHRKFHLMAIIITICRCSRSGILVTVVEQIAIVAKRTSEFHFWHIQLFPNDSRFLFWILFLLIWVRPAIDWISLDWKSSGTNYMSKKRKSGTLCSAFDSIH